jgi:uncharacterized protein (DUF1778 family)
MDAATQNKNERINLRLKSSAKSLIERAASFEGKTVSHFILTSALEQAEKTVQEHEIMTLNAKNSRILRSFSRLWPLRCVSIANWPQLLKNMISVLSANDRFSKFGYRAA